MTYLFAGDPILLKRFIKDRETGRTVRHAGGQKKKGDLKRSISKLVEQEYGGLIEEAVTNDRALTLRDFRDADAVGEMVNRVVAFQTTRLADIPDKYKKYKKYAQKRGHVSSAGSHPPLSVVPPYFSLDLRSTSDWLEINADLVKRTPCFTDLPIFPLILASASTLAEKGKEIAARYAEAKPDGYVLWVDGFSSDQDASVLRIVQTFVERLSKSSKPVVMLYGDAFSLALSYAGLTGFGCGICYAEQKLSTKDLDVEGLIPPRYYIRRLKKKVRIETELRRIDLSKYDGLKCNCEICRRQPDPGRLDDVESREHFMLVRKMEIDAIRGGPTKADFANELERAFTKYASDPLLAPLGHLRNWANVLKGN
jgi:hypothetical protein